MIINKIKSEIVLVKKNKCKKVKKKVRATIVICAMEFNRSKTNIVNRNTILYTVERLQKNKKLIKMKNHRKLSKIIENY